MSTKNRKNIKIFCLTIRRVSIKMEIIHTKVMTFKSAVYSF